MLVLIRRVNIVANHVIFEKDIPVEKEIRQMDFFSDVEKEEREKRIAPLVQIAVKLSGAFHFSDVIINIQR